MKHHHIVTETELTGSLLTAISQFLNPVKQS